MIQLGSTNSERELVRLYALVQSINTDPDLAGIFFDTRVPGCDYVSFFAYVGKTTFLTTFYQYASFIAGKDLPGSIGEDVTTEQSSAFYSFLRLVGCECMHQLSVHNHP